MDHRSDSSSSHPRPSFLPQHHAFPLPPFPPHHHPQNPPSSPTPPPHPPTQPAHHTPHTFPPDYRDFHHPFPPPVTLNFAPNYPAHDGFGTLGKTCVSDSANFPVSSPEALLNTLSVIQQNVQQLQACVHLIAHGGGQPAMPQQQQALAAGVASVISQLVVAAAGLLQQSSAPSAQIFATNPQLSTILGGPLSSRFNVFHQGAMEDPLGEALGNLESFCVPSTGCSPIVNGMGTCSSIRGSMVGSDMTSSGLRDQSCGGQGLISSPGNPEDSLVPRIGNTLGNPVEVEVVAKGSPSSALGVNNNHGMDVGVGNQFMAHGSEGLQPTPDDHDSGPGLRDDEDDAEGESLPPGSYDLVEMDAAEILAEHTHFCEICGKGFKRDANLRMHMRGHGDEFKTPAALARPDKSTHDPSSVKPRRYSCPFVGCKRNKKHHKFLPLKTMLCVKNHYRRSHCPKMLTCNKCKTKKFSVVADLKTHEKHCGRDKWQCSCGTTFSRKDKLFGHIGLFTGHTPALPYHEMDGSVSGLESASDCFTPRNREGLEGLSCSEPVLLGATGPTSFLHENPAISASVTVESGGRMKRANQSDNGVGGSRSAGLQEWGHRGGCLSFTEDSSGASLGDRASPPSSLGLVSNSSMLHGLLSGNFIQQADDSN